MVDAKTVDCCTVSVITPAYNASDFVDETIRSVVSQTFEDWELIIVDDCSTDDTVLRVLAWSEKDSRIRLIQNKNNIGPGPSRNRAVEGAFGRYIAYLDSDDLWKSQKLEKQISHISELKAPFVYASYDIVSCSGEAVGQEVIAPERVEYKDLLKNTVVGCLTVLVDRHVVKDLEMPDIASRQPLVLWLRILREHGPAYGLKETLASYRVRPNSVSSNKAKSARSVWRVYREYEGIGLIASCYYFSCYAWNALIRNRRSMKFRR